MPSAESLKKSCALETKGAPGTSEGTTLRWQVSQWTPSRSPARGSSIPVRAWPLVCAVGVWQRRQRARMPGASCSATETVARKSGSRAALAIIDEAQVSWAMYRSPDPVVSPL
jgi:hypothetical protein